MRLRRYTIKPELFLFLLTAGDHGVYSVRDGGMPADAVLLNLRQTVGRIEILIASETFPEFLPEGSAGELLDAEIAIARGIA